MPMKAPINNLQRSKSLSSADAIARGIAGLGLALGNEATDIGQFTPEIQTIIDKANEDPNQLNARTLMDLATQLLQRSVDGRRYVVIFTYNVCMSVCVRSQALCLRFSIV